MTAFIDRLTPRAAGSIREARAQALGFRVVHLDTTEEQVAARRLYESAGYRETGRRPADRFVFIDFAKPLPT